MLIATITIAMPMLYRHYFASFPQVHTAKYIPISDDICSPHISRRLLLASLAYASLISQDDALSYLWLELASKCSRQRDAEMENR